MMLHMMREDPDVVVVHFDHGIRENSHEDAEFVRKLAESYGLPFELGVGKLGPDVNEAGARKARWDFLFGLCGDGDKVHTAHHKDDVVETVVINCLRGTGWRGLAVLGDSERIERPLINMSKAEICRYAGENELHFRQDQTNNTEDYLRNRVREKLRDTAQAQIERVVELAEKQNDLKVEIDGLIEGVLHKTGGVDEKSYRMKRKMMASLPEEIALEVLRKVVERTMVRSLTRMQLNKLLSEIITLQNGKRISFGKEYFIEITREDAVFNKKAPQSGGWGVVKLG